MRFKCWPVSGRGYTEKTYRRGPQAEGGSRTSRGRLCPRHGCHRVRCADK
jgi:hypothetical protein